MFIIARFELILFMENKSLKTGVCPVCDSQNVYTDKEVSKRGERMIVPVTSFRQIYSDCYICINCGFIQEFVREKDLKDEKLISKLKEIWNRVI
jgi:predicted RNA-binding Zn-ribbon protein involved in translation (DUF1610 family)